MLNIDPALAMFIGSTLGAAVATLLSVIIHNRLEAEWRNLVADLIRQRLYLVEQRSRIQSDLGGLAKAGEAAFAMVLKSIDTLTEENLGVVRSLRSTLDRAKKHAR